MSVLQFPTQPRGQMSAGAIIAASGLSDEAFAARLAVTDGVPAIGPGLIRLWREGRVPEPAAVITDLLRVVGGGWR